LQNPAAWAPQDIPLIARYGIEDISVPAGVLATSLQPDKARCNLHLPEKKLVELHLKLGYHNPLDWVAQVNSLVLYNV
jgi:hypothetical protein